MPEPGRTHTWTDRAARVIIAPMRYIALTFLLFLAACGADPAALGITGAVAPAVLPDPGEVSTGIAGAPSTGTQYGPSVTPNTGAGRFWGYN